MIPFTFQRALPAPPWLERAFTAARSTEMAILLLWLLLVTVALKTRPLLPIDETRYLSVAWEMWRTDSFLVPLLNGQPYSHKPPLLFWLIDAGWWLFGVRETWGRLVAPLFGLASLFAARALARALWPQAPERGELMPWLLLGCLAWALFATVTMFDMLMVLFSTMAILGLVRAWRATSWREQAGAWVLVSASLGLGGLAKGPVVLVYVLPAALLAPLWMSAPRPHWMRHYASLIGAVTAGFVIVLAWAIPAAEAGGVIYARAILWGQTAGRITEAFAHQRGFWWYLPVLPALLFPWILWPPAWRAAAMSLRNADSGVRLGLVWLVGGVAVLSLISGKQPHYLLPLFPAAALLVAPALAQVRIDRWSAMPPAALIFVLGGVLAGLAYWLQTDPDATEQLGVPAFARNIPIAFGLTLMIVAAVVGLARIRDARLAAIALALQSVAVVVLLHSVAFKPIAFAYDVTGMANYIRHAGPIAILGEYHGQFGFVGRLERPLRVVTRQEAPQWLAPDPRRQLILTDEDMPPRWLQALYAQPYRGRALLVVDRDNYEAYLSMVRMRAAGQVIDRRVPARAAPAANAQPADRRE